MDDLWARCSQEVAFFEMSVRLGPAYDLLCLLFLSILAMLAVAINVAVPASTIAALRVILGVSLVAFFPGYALAAALFPGREDLTTLERLGLSLGASLPAAFSVGFLLNYTPWGIRLSAASISLVLFVALCCAVAYHRRMALPPDQRFGVILRWCDAGWQGRAWPDRLLAAALIFSIAVLGGTSLFFLARPKVGERFTEFYVLGPARQAEGYPRDVASGEPTALIVGVGNYEHTDVEYTVEVAVSARTEQVARVRLGHGERWEGPYALTLTEPGEARIRLLLYRQGDREPYRSLQLWITVKEEVSTS